jgi:hypothetical protein
MGNPINQTEVAAWFEVNRTTVRQWQALGLPFVRQGREAIFDSAVAIHWGCGLEDLRRLGQPVPEANPLTVCVVSLMLAPLCEPADLAFTATAIGKSLRLKPAEVVAATAEAGRLIARRDSA